MRYARRMNGYSEVPHNGEINNYLRKDLDAKATAKNLSLIHISEPTRPY